MNNLLSLLLAILFMVSFSVTYMLMETVGFPMPTIVVDTQPVAKVWTKGIEIDDLWCEVSSYAPDKHWCDYQHQRGVKALESFCADKDNSVQCEGI